LAEIVEDFRRALSTIVPWEFFKLFTPSEICHVIAGESYKISRVDLSFIKTAYGYGYGPESPQVHWLIEIHGDMTPNEQGRFVQFVTEAPNLPFGCLKALDPLLTIALRVPETEDRLSDETLSRRS
jgi:hypothetical protein